MRLTLLIFFICVQYLFAQNNFRYPLENIVVTGNYAEIRNNHFHAGLDLRTDPIKNLPIYSIENGYVSRIKVSSFGYGKVMYITHPGGIVSVYAHQHHFSEKIEKFVRKKQTEKETFEIEIIPDKNDLSILKGEVIGFTGNTGSSEAPHLHFELRDEKTEVALNPFLYFKFKDVVPPDLNKIYFFETTDLNNPNVIFKKSINKKKLTLTKQTSSSIKEYYSDELIQLPECTGFAFSSFDQHDLNGSLNQIYTAELFLDDVLFYKHAFDSIAFDKTRYINCFTELGKSKSEKIQKCFLSKNEDLPIFKTINVNGELFLKDTLIHKLKLVLSDVNNNKNISIFKIKKNNTLKVSTSVKKKYDCFKEIILKQEGEEVVFKEKTFFNDVDINLEKISGNLIAIYSNVQSIFKPFTIKMKPDKLINDTSKYCIVEKNKNTYCGGNFKNDFVVATSKNLGVFMITADTIPPQIIHNKKNKLNKLSFTVTDNLSGISDFKLYLNDKWQYAEYEYKNNMIFCPKTENLPKGKYNFKLIVYDKKKNKKEISGIVFL
jgi:murein DD-endopeptidase MepM/ murein hydrolase activator NlpD